MERYFRRIYKGLSKDAIENGKKHISEDKFVIIQLKRELVKLDEGFINKQLGEIKCGVLFDKYAHVIENNNDGCK